MTKIKTANLTDLALDWTVAHCQSKVNVGVYGEAVVIEQKLHLHYCDVVLDSTYDPSTDWAQGGPIIDRERIDCISDPNGTAVWMGRNWVQGRNLVQGREIRLFGPTPLIAAMRCFVASRLGDEVEVPDELVEAV